MQVSAPGKLFLSGEWSVLEVGNPGIVAAVDKRVHVEIDENLENEHISISVDDFKIEDAKAIFEDNRLKWDSNVTDDERARLVFMKNAIETALRYLNGFFPFRIRSWGEKSQITIEGKTKKIGFGSSAAAVVATIAALLQYSGLDISTRETKDKIYKLSTIAHYFAQGKVGSAFDVAASTYGGLFVYKRFDPGWLMKQIDEGRSIKEIVEQDWPGFYIENLYVPNYFILLVAWTKEPSSTSKMVKQMDEFKKNSPDEYNRIYSDITRLVEQLRDAWNSEDREKIIELLRKNELILHELTQKSGVSIETTELKRLADIANDNGAAGKLSGAGGGDCGIAICFSNFIAENVKKKWEEAGFYLLDTTIDKKGVVVRG